MSCPHSTADGSSPDWCSQCLGAKVKRVSYDEKHGRLTVGGKLVEISENAPPNKGRQNNGGIRAKLCSRCGRVGHTMRVCDW